MTELQIHPTEAVDPITDTIRSEPSVPTGAP